MSGFSYYIYFRAAERQTAELEARIRAMQAKLAAVTGITGRLLKKCGEPLLWMEVYEGIADPSGFERTLAATVTEFGIAECLQAGASRKTECFEQHGESHQ